MTQDSSHVLQGKAVQTWSDWNSQHNLIFTYTKFQVTHVWKGQAASLVVIKQPGGRVGATTERVYGVRYLQPAQESVLFLRPAEELDGTFVITGLMQGNFSVQISEGGDKMVSNGMPEVSAYSLSTGQVSAYRGNTMRLQDLKSRVAKAAQP